MAVPLLMENVGSAFEGVEYGFDYVERLPSGGIGGAQAGNQPAAKCIHREAPNCLPGGNSHLA
jgi:hypothetical protein